MKKLLIFLLLTTAWYTALAQIPPKAINYQSVVRNGAGTPCASFSVSQNGAGHRTAFGFV